MEEDTFGKGFARKYSKITPSISKHVNETKNRQDENEKDKIKLFLETSLNKRVKESTISLFKIDPKEQINTGITYQVWINNPAIVQHAEKSILTNDFSPKNEYDLFAKGIDFKVGQIDYDKFRQPSSSEWCKLVLCQVYPGNITILYPDEKNDPLFDCGYSSVGPISKFAEKNELTPGHYFLLKDPRRIVYLAIVNFTSDLSSIRCFTCDEKPSFYCQNDKQYLCPACNRDVHSSTICKTYSEHKVIPMTNYSNIYSAFCNISGHSLKPYEFYCFQCKGVYCIMCLTSRDHKNMKDHEVRSLSDISSYLEQETKTVA